MNFSNFNLLFILLLSGARTYLQCDSDDLIALNDFASRLTSEIYGWNGNRSDCCSWPGVTCGNSSAFNRRVTRLELANLKLTATSCNSWVGMDQLKILNLSYNFLEGFLPDKLFKMQNLQVLDLRRNLFSGPIPEEIHMPSIRYIDMSDNRLAGSVSSALCLQSPFVHTLNLASNDFSGEISINFQKCTSLQRIFLNGNYLSGGFPKSFLNLQDLRILHLQDNHFFGPLVTEIGNLSSLTEFDVSFNSFSGDLPDIFGGLQKLQHFSANTNGFRGHLPKSLVNSSSLLSLDLSNNSFFGPINISCSVMINLISLDFSGNNFNGSLPESISFCKRLTILSLSRNNFSGEIPYSFKNLKALTLLSLSKNSLRNASAAFGVLQHCSNLTTLALSMNFKGEEMPNEKHTRFKNLKVLVIGNSQLRGLIPKWLKECKRLQLLDLSWNLLSGSIPIWMGSFNYLFYLDLSNNSLTGDIPKSLTEFQILRNTSTLIDRNILGVPFYETQETGTRLQYRRIESFRPTIDLSKNKLSGIILPSFGNLRRLHVLKVNENLLSGPIPDDLAEMASIEILDLSHNKLSGEIPSSLTRLSFISKFSVADNQLYGAIPTGGQFMTFPCSSFERNAGLYSPSNWGSCYAAETPHEIDPGQVEDESEKMTIMGLQFGIGAAVGFVLTVHICFLSG